MTEVLARTLGTAQRAILDNLPDYLTNIETGERQPTAGLTRRQVPQAWVQGLRAAGVDARVAKVRRSNGGGFVTLPLVVEYPCPHDHVDESRERFAKVRLLVNVMSGWVTIHEDSCGSCSQSDVETWLITCPACAAGEDTERHPISHDEDWCGPFSLSCGDESPLAFVVEAMAATLAGLTDKPEPKAERKEWTEASAVEWIDQQQHGDGTPLVPPTLGQAAAWDAVRRIEGHPPQLLVREAQKARKRRATQPPDG